MTRGQVRRRLSVSWWQYLALALLPLAQRTAFQLTFYHDMAYTEIAEIMDCPVNTIKTRLFHARKRLAALLDGQLEGRP